MKRFLARIPFIKLFIVGLVLLVAFLVYLDANLQKAFSGKLWAMPAQVYARPLELYEGAELSKAQLRQELDMLGYRAVKKALREGEVAWGPQIQLVSRSFKFAGELEPSRHISLQIAGDRITQMRSSDSAAIIRLDPLNIGSLSPSHSEDRLLVSLAQVPKPLQQLLVASEDRAFYDHRGVSLRGVSRAILANIKQQRLSQGGSTLTQQLVKNYFLTNERTLKRKLVEVCMAVLLEFHLDKNTILESYINEIYLGQDGPRAIHGFGLASEYYFEKPVEALALHEQALLVALVRGPSYYNPFRNKDRALSRRNLMLDLAAEQGFISKAEATKAKQQVLMLVAKKDRKSLRMPAYLELVRRQLQQYYSDADLSSEGLRIFTHFDPIVQAETERAVMKVVPSLNGGIHLQAAAIMVKPQSGAVVAVVGDKNPRYPGFNRALDAKRHVGSVIKPAVYLTALLQAQQYHLLSPLSDDASEWPQADGSVWSPSNFDGKSHGEVVLYKAMANSYNQAAANLGMSLGLPAVIDVIKRLGIDQAIPEYPSVLLGALNLSPLQVAQMYQTIAGSGFYSELNSIQVVVDEDDHVLNRFGLTLEQRVDSKSMALLQFALNRVTIEGSAKSLAWLMPKRVVAGKTGTSNELRDSWFAGFSGDLLGVVWLGRDDNTPTAVTGASGALRVWAKAFNALADEDVQLSHNAELAYLGYEPETGETYDVACNRPIKCGSGNLINTIQQRVREWFK